MQTTEHDSEIFVLVVDETHDSGETWAQISERYRLDLEKELEKPASTIPLLDQIFWRRVERIRQQLIDHEGGTAHEIRWKGI